MAQLWGGRFTGETDALVYAFNASISFDRRLLPQDIRGSRAHACMLARCGILTQEEADAIYNSVDSDRYLSYTEIRMCLGKRYADNVLSSS